jgi:hypothetical protein
MSNHIECDDLLALSACSIEEQLNADIRVSIVHFSPLYRVTVLHTRDVVTFRRAPMASRSALCP